VLLIVVVNDDDDEDKEEPSFESRLGDLIGTNN
jgi:hypothetical protein